MSASTQLPAPPPTRLEKLELENFRCFSRLEVEFHEKLTVIVAPNGGGKTALLDAACFGWHYFVQGTDFEELFKNLRNEDVRQVPKPDGTMIPMKPVRLHGTTLVAGERTEWTVEKGGKTAKNTSTQGADPMREAGRRLRQALQDNAEGKLVESVTLPTIGYYGTGRLWAPQKVTAARRRQIKADTSPISGYDQCLSPSSRFALFEVWFARYSLAALQEKYDGNASSHRSGDKLAGVKAALDALLRPATGWHSFSFDVNNESILALHDAHGELPVSKLSDGLRIMIGLAGDIAHRCVRLNPHLGATAPQLTPGVIMIDEVDMHLHPEWQQLVLRALQDAFPLIQFIVTTHSPQVVTTARRENIRMLIQTEMGTWEARMPDRNPYAHANSVALETVMGGHAYPPTETVDMLREYQRLVGAGEHDSADALELRSALEAEWGKTDPELLLMDVTIRKNETLRKLRDHHA